MPAPSIVAASSISAGTVIKNCLIINIPNAPANPGHMAPKTDGGVTAAAVLITPNRFTILNKGTIVTCTGTIIPTSMSPNITFFPLKERRA